MECETAGNGVAYFITRNSTFPVKRFRNSIELCRVTMPFSISFLEQVVRRDKITYWGTINDWKYYKIFLSLKVLTVLQYWSEFDKFIVIIFSKLDFETVTSSNSCMSSARREADDIGHQSGFHSKITTRNVKTKLGRKHIQHNRKAVGNTMFTVLIQTKH